MISFQSDKYVHLSVIEMFMKKTKINSCELSYKIDKNF